MSLRSNACLANYSTHLRLCRKRFLKRAVCCLLVCVCVVLCAMLNHEKMVERERDREKEREGKATKGCVNERCLHSAISAASGKRNSVAKKHKTATVFNLHAWIYAYQEKCHRHSMYLTGTQNREGERERELYGWGRNRRKCNSNSSCVYVHVALCSA